MNMKSTAINTLEYTGIVTLSQYTNGKKIKVAEIHNAGGKALFNFLADCLIEDFDVARTNRPKKILLLKEDETGNVETVSNTGFIPLLTKPEKIYSETEGIVRYSFIIPQEYFVGTGFNAIGLYPNSALESDIRDYAAYCKVNTGDWSISMSSVLVLDWELHISNG